MHMAGAMYKAIASVDLVVAMGRGGMIGFFGTGGLDPHEIENAIRRLQTELVQGESWGMNLLANNEVPELEQRTVELYQRHLVRFVEAAAFTTITPALAALRLKGLQRDSQGRVRARVRILAKVSRVEVATAFLNPVPEALARRLVQSGQISAAEAELGSTVAVADELCVESDSAGHTDRGVAFALLPSMIALRNQISAQREYTTDIAVGAAGGIGTPEAAAAAFIMGADFVTTGSINQCTVEAGTSSAVKDLLQEMEVHDTTLAPAGDMFEVGAKVQVLKRGLFFPMRANKLYDLYQRYGAIDEIDDGTRRQIEDRFFGRSFDDVWKETCDYLQRVNPARLTEIERSPKQKMAAIFKWYFVHSARLALAGTVEKRVDFQVHCGPALGAFNRWVKGTPLQNWRSRYVAEIGGRIMAGAAELMNRWFSKSACDASNE